jgi:hypothetical protein
MVYGGKSGGFHKWGHPHMMVYNGKILLKLMI